MPRVALVNPNRYKPGVAPIALEYLASGLRLRGVEFEMLDLCHSTNVAADIRSFFSEKSFDLIAVTIRNLDDVWFARPFVDMTVGIIERIRQVSSSPIVLGGSGYSIAPEKILDICGADFGIAGEGEVALPMLAASIGDGKRYSLVPGLVWRDGDRLRRNSISNLDLASARLCERGMIDHSCYTYANGDKGGAGVQTKRGCGHNCIYCVVPNIEGRKVRLRAPSDIVDEMANLYETGVRRFFMCDSEFNDPEYHAAAICNEIISRGLADKITWQAYTSPAPFSPALAELMKRAGCDMILATFDHGCDAMLERMGKNFRADDIRKAVEAARYAELDAIYSLMLGGPGESMATIEETMNLVSELKPIKISLSDPPGIRIYPNTPMADIVLEEGFTTRNPNLQGKIKGNDDFYQPVFYLSHKMGLLGKGIRAWRKLGMLKARVFG